MSGIRGTVNDLRPKLKGRQVIYCRGEFYCVGSLSDTGLTGFQILDEGGVDLRPTNFSSDDVIEIIPGMRMQGGESQ